MILGTLPSRRTSACTFAVPSQNWHIQAVRWGLVWPQREAQRSGTGKIYYS